MTSSQNATQADRCAANRKKPIRLKLGSPSSQLAHSEHLRYFSIPREQLSKVALNQKSAYTATYDTMQHFEQSVGITVS